MKYAAIMMLLMGHLEACAEQEKLRIAPEGRSFSPKSGEAFLRPILLMTTPQASGLGNQATNTQRGIFQIDVLSPDTGGWMAPTRIADAVCTAFRRGLKLTDEGVDLTVQCSGIGPAMKEEGRYKLPVNVTFWAFTDNN